MHQNTPFQVKVHFFSGRRPSSLYRPQGYLLLTFHLSPHKVFWVHLTFPQNSSRIYATARRHHLELADLALSLLTVGCRTLTLALTSSADGVELVEITGRSSVDDPVDNVEYNERQRKTFPRQFVDTSRSTFACIYVDCRPWRNDHRRSAGVSRRRLAVRCTDTSGS